MSVKQDWEDAVDAEVKGGKSRTEAIAIVNRTHPGLREAMLAQFQEDHGNHRAAADWQRQAVEAGPAAR